MPPQGTKRKFSKTNFAEPQENVKIVVGKDGKVFNVWKTLLCEKSPYFERALNGGFKEGSGTVVLEEEDPSTFGLFVQWSYTDKLPDWRARGTFGYFDLVRLWVLADYLQVPGLQNGVADKLVETVGDHIYMVVIPFVYEKTALGSPLRKMFVHQVYFGGYPSHWFIKNRRYLPYEFLLELAAFHGPDIEKRDYTRGDYHVAVPAKE